MSRTLDGKVAIVTGAAQGIGAAYARHLAGLGATTVVADIDAEGAEKTAKEIEASGLSAFAAPVDISDPEATTALPWPGRWSNGQDRSISSSTTPPSTRALPWSWPRTSTSATGAACWT